MNATAHTLVTETASTADALTQALQNPFRITLPDAATADKWHRVCHTLAANPILHDTIADELTAMATHFASLAPSYTQAR